MDTDRKAGKRTRTGRKRQAGMFLNRKKQIGMFLKKLRQWGGRDRPPRLECQPCCQPLDVTS